MTVNLEDLVARLRLDTSGLDAGMASASSSLDRAGSAASRAGTRMSVGLTAPLVGIGVASVNLAGTFDKTMRQVGIATGGATDALSDLAMEMGAQTAFSAGEAADAMLELAKGGMTAAQIEGGALAATMKLASAGGIDLASASTYVSNAMAAYGLKAKDADAVTVALAGAANASSASVESLGMGLAQGQGAARNYGLSLQETTGALALFDSQALKGSDAGTSLKSMLNSLIPTTTKARDAMQQANLDFVDARGNFVGLRDMADQLQKGLGGLSEAQRAQALETIFGSDGMRAATALMNGGAAAVDRYTKASYDNATTTKLADAAMQGISGAVERAKGSMETAALVIGQALAPAVMTIAGYVERAANAFTNLPSGVQQTIVVLGVVAAAIGPLLVAFGAVAASLSAITGLFAASAPAATAAGAAAGATAAPFLAIAAVLAVVAAGFVILYQRSQTFRSTVQAGVAQVASAFAGLRAVVMPIVSQIVGVFVAQLPQIRATVASVFGNVKSIVTSVMSIITSVIKVATTVIRALWATFGSTILSTISRVMSSLQQVIRGAFNVIAGIFKTIASALRGDWSGMWDGIKQIASGAVGILGGIVSGLFALLRGIFSGAIAALVALARQIWSDVTATFRNGVELVVGAVRALPDKIKGVFAGAAQLLYSIGSDIVSGLVNGIQSAAGRVYDAAMSLVDKIPGPIRKIMGIASPSKVMHEIGVQIAQGLELGMRDSMPAVTAARDALADSVDGLHDLISKKLDKVWDGKKLEKYVSKVRKTLKDEEGAVRKTAGTYDRLVGQYNAARAAGIEAYDAIIERLNIANEKTAELRDQQADYARSVTESFTSFGSVIGLGGRKDAEGNDLVATSTSILEDLRTRAVEAEEYRALVSQLATDGLNDTTVQQLIAAGVEGGLATARAIASGGAAAIAETNALTAQITAAGAALGALTAARFYQSGVDSAAAIAAGIANEAHQSQTATAETLAGIARTIEETEEKMRKQMRKLGVAATDGLAEGMTAGDKLKKTAKAVAKAIRDEVKAELGIKSPSRVFAEIGVQTADGLVVGLDSMLRNVTRAGDRVAAAVTPDLAAIKPPQIGTRAFASNAAAFGAMQPMTVRVFIGETELTDIVRVQIGDTLAPLRTITRQGG